MKGKTFDTVVALAPEGVFRLDLPDGALLSSRHARGGATDALTAALGLSRLRRSARVLVLSSEFFSQTIRLPRRQVAGLSNAEIETALAYEIEPFSNIARENGIAAFQPLPDEAADTASWRAVQISLADWDSLAAAVHAAGGRLAGCAALDPLPGGDDAVAGELLRIAADAQAEPPRIPVAAPASASAQSARLPKAAMMIFILVALACGIHWLIASRACARLRADVDAREALAAVNNRIANELRGVESRRDKIVRDTADRAAAADSLLAYRKAWGSLFHDLSAACGDDVMLRSISGGIDPSGVDVEAIATDVDAPASCMARLAAMAAESGWALTPREVRNLPNGPSSFRFSLKFAGTSRKGGAE